MKRHILVLFFGLLICMSIVPMHIQAATEEQTVPQKVEYVLPYPGILSDNPLYALKNLRDKIMEWLIADPVKKIEFYILQSDKDLNAAIFLREKGREALASEAIARGNKTLGAAVIMAGSVKKQGRELPGYVIERLQNSLMKHEEVLQEFVQKSSESQKSNFEKALAVIQGFVQDVAKLK